MTRLAAAWLIACASVLPAHAQWPQWGGPARDFTVAAEIAAWDPAGPPLVWSRALGDGFSAIVVADARAFTVYRDGNVDVTVALDLASGTVAWEHRAEAPFRETCSERLGPAPRSTPLAAGRWLFTVSAGGKLQALDRDRGTLVWQRDLYGARPDDVRACGYASSPIAVDDTIIVPVGGAGQALIAMSLADGRVRWQRHDFAIGYSSPLAIEVDGQRQLVALMGQAIVGVDPASGALLWQHPHPTFSDVNVMTPVWTGDGVLFLSSGYDGGSRALRLTREGDRTQVTELWAHKRFRVHFGNAIRVGRMVIGSNGDFGSAPVTGIDIDSGQILWRSRAAGRAAFLAVGRQVLALDEDGRLLLASADRDALTVSAESRLLDGVSWTPPTIAGDLLLVRNHQTIAAYRLSLRG